MRILFVCLGNICRSPTAEAAVREALVAEGLAHAVQVDSAGTGSWHVGSPPDARMRAAAAADGLVLEGIARQFTVDDFDRFDLVFAMDRANVRDLRELARDDVERGKVRLFRDFDPDGNGSPLDVPDPYYGGAEGFREVVAMARRTARSLVADIAART